ncbi:hypothetical protein LJK88_44175 [Paenibacillus sp. P26]|nr:hypothetical protein LJK88_44175 [Paenibacillus sp. P26]UUZ92309.1 hypothetical protein LJK87_44145 [Paenibacillus sp. P25]
MTVKHSIKCQGSEILVRETEEGQYHVAIQASNNPLGYGNVLETFADQEKAIRAAEQFCKQLAAAKERGYYLEEGHFVKPEREKIPVAAGLKEEMEVEQWIEQYIRG